MYARYGFDIVVEATGVEGVAQHALNYVRRGGKLLVYGVYDSSALVHWPPSKIFGDEIRVCTRSIVLRCCSSRSHKIIGSFAQMHCFPRAISYLESGKVNVKGMVRSHLFEVLLVVCLVLNRTRSRMFSTWTGIRTRLKR